MPADDPSFFLKLAFMNLDRREDEAAIACLESASARAPSPDQRSRIVEAAEAILARAGASGNEALAGRSRALLGGTRAAGTAPAPAPSPATATSSPSSVELVRRLLVSPELVDRLKALVGSPREPAPVAGLSLPVASVVARLLSADLELARTAAVALELVVEATRADRGFLILECGAMRSFGSPGAPVRPPETSEGILREVARTKRSLILLDAATDARFASRESIQGLQVRSVLCVPVLEPDDGSLLGSIYLDAPSGAGRFGTSERELAESLAAAVAPALRNACRYEESRLEVARLKRAFAEARRPEDTSPRLLGESHAMKELDRLLARVAPGTHTVLIEGESGTGKELVARTLHARSERANGPFVAENVAALANGIVEAELFGHAKGAFTGAEKSRPGLFQLAHGGTLFLDEVGEMTEDLQRKLLRVLQERTLRPLGGSTEVAVDVRVLAATHRDLLEMVRAGEFREDLFYRLSVVKIRVPPLRERKDDIPLLLRHFVAEAAHRQDDPPPALDPALLARALAHPWEGNVRELMAFATRIVVEGPGAELVPPSQRPPANANGFGVEVHLGDAEPLTFRAARDTFERAYLDLVLKRFGGNVSAAAAALDLSRSYASELVKRFGLRAKASD